VPQVALAMVGNAASNAVANAKMRIFELLLLSIPASANVLRRSYRFLVALLTSGDLLIYAKDLLVEATHASLLALLAATIKSQSSSSLGLRQFMPVCVQSSMEWISRRLGLIRALVAFLQEIVPQNGSGANSPVLIFLIQFLSKTPIECLY